MMTSRVTWKHPVSSENVNNVTHKPWSSLDRAPRRTRSYRDMSSSLRDYDSGTSPTWRDVPQLRRGRPERALIKNPDVGNAILVDTCLDLMRDSLMSTLAKCKNGRRVVRTDPSEQYVFERKVSRHLWKILSDVYDANADFVACNDGRPVKRSSSSVERIISEARDTSKYRPPWRP